MLGDKEFLFYLELFYAILPRVDTLFSQLQRINIDVVQTQRIVANLVSSISKVCDSVASICAQFCPDTPWHGGAPILQKIGSEVCDTVVANAKDRFTFTAHLAAAVLFDSEHFPEYADRFPHSSSRKGSWCLSNVEQTTSANPDFRSCSSAMALFLYILAFCLSGVLSGLAIVAYLLFISTFH